MGLLEDLAVDTTDREWNGLEEFGGSPPSLFPHGYRREERLTSRLISTLVLVRPFAQRFTESLDITSRRPTTVTRNLGGYRASGVVEPRLAGSKHRADAALSLRYGTFEPWRCAFEVKYLSEGRNSPPTAVKLSSDQVERTYLSARGAGFDHVVTISADQPEGRTNPSGFEPSAEDLTLTGLSHLSWLKVLSILRETRVGNAKSLSPAEVRILADFERYLQESNIWKHAREVSLGRHFSAVRRFCQDPTKVTVDTGDAGLADVASKWLQLTESVAQRLSIETDTLVRANGRRPSIDAVVKGLDRNASLVAQFKSESPDGGVVKVEVDLVSERVRGSWEVEVARLTPTRNPQSRTRWTACESLLERWPGYKGQVTILGRDGSTLVGPVSFRNAAEGIAAVNSDSSAVPHRIRIERSQTAARNGRLRGDTIAKVVERNALGMAPWSRSGH
jgi:hypothetical protein